METSDKVVDILKSVIPRRPEPANVSRDFWMPDHSCRVCYECDSQFTFFNRRHHCRLCGRIFCGKCTANSVPILSDDPKVGGEDGERIRVCNFCFKQWEKEVVAANHGVRAYTPVVSSTLSTTSLVGTQSSGTVNSIATTICSYSTGTHQHVRYSSGPSPGQSTTNETLAYKQDALISGRGMDSKDPSPSTQLSYRMNRYNLAGNLVLACPVSFSEEAFMQQ